MNRYIKVISEAPKKATSRQRERNRMENPTQDVVQGSPVFEGHEPIHDWFELTYSSYLVIQRSILQSMPVEWQRRFVACLRELESVSPGDLPSSFWVQAKTRDGKFRVDPYRDYERGRRRVALKRPGPIQERQRQIEVEGCTPERDDSYFHGELLRAANCYIVAESDRLERLKAKSAINPSQGGAA